MATFTQDNRYLAVTTPLGKDVLLLEGFSGTEKMSGLFAFTLDLLTEKSDDVKFESLLGQAVTVMLQVTKDQKRYINGIVRTMHQSRQEEAAKDKTLFVRYRAEVVPALWLLTRMVRSRTFQHLTVPDILKKVLDGSGVPGLVVTYKLEGTWEERDYVAQYRESDFAFASRLMEEEGIFYYFVHTDGKHEMVVSNNSATLTDVAGTAKIVFDEIGGGVKTSERVSAWEKTQELRSGKYTLWDHTFELPDKNLEAQQVALTSAAAGTVTHKLKFGANENLEIYDYPGAYAGRFDNVDKSGGDQAAKLQKVFDDNKRTVKIRMEQETVEGLTVSGKSDCRNFASGYTFTLDKHFNADGKYLLTSVTHKASLRGAYLSGGMGTLEYGNGFECIPTAVPYRPQRTTPRPVVQGTQTAIVVGPDGQEIFTDKYSRVKVQFYWDREGKKNADSSCWLRVGTLWAGQQWGMIHIPRIGQEVIVAFLEGDPDQPIIVGSVYNDANMPPYTLPDNMTQSGLKTRSTLKGDAETYNELRFEDKKDSEQVYFHAQKNFDRVVENNDTLKVGSDKADDGSQTREIWKDRTTTIHTGNETFTIEKGNRTETIKKGDETITIETGSRTHKIKTDETVTIEGKQTHTVTGDQTVTVKSGNQSIEVQSGNHSLKVGAGTSTTDAAKNITLKVGANKIVIDVGGTITVEAATTIELKVGGSSVKIEAAGVTVSGPDVKVSGTASVEISAPSITIG
jgi:type VI secretion system secreted protein VgrG